MLLGFLEASGAASAGQSTGDRVWLAASDIHLDPFNGDAQPSLFGSDTNVALFRSSLAAMKKAVPNPAVVLLPGDFFAHDFARLAAHGAGKRPTVDVAIETMRRIASAFDRAFPNAQFAIALGNNDAPCGDYRSDAGDSYLAALARIWAPLVDRRGAAPDFSASFERGGYYTAALPIRGLRLVALNSVPFSSEYRGSCGGDAASAAPAELAWLRATLASTPRGAHNVVMMHIPPGYDAFSTQTARGLIPWRFLNAGDDASLLGALTAPSDRVEYAIAGHAHRFDFRLAGSVPILVLGSISPVYHNNPAFYALHVGGDGALRDIDIYAFDEWTQEWQPARSFDRKWNVNGIDVASLTAIHARLETDPALRRAWDAASSGWPSNPELGWTMWGKLWRVPWCTQTALDAGFEQCAGIERRVMFFRIVVPAIAGGAVAIVVVSVVAIVRRRRRLLSRNRL